MAQDILGLENGQVVLVPSNSSWSEAFEREASHLKLVMKNRLLGIEHVGSTAIPASEQSPFSTL